MDMLTAMKKEFNYKTTTNGAVALKSTLDKVYDLFAFGGAYRARTEGDCITLFAEAFKAEPELAIKCLAYLRDISAGQGERRFFRACWKYMAMNYSEIVIKNTKAMIDNNICRWDDIFVLLNTPCEDFMYACIAEQLAADLKSEHPSLCAKWMPSLNSYSDKSRTLAKNIVNRLSITNKQYRKMLAKLREKINIVERLISANQWSAVDYSAVPSKAGINYYNAFIRHDGKRYLEFICDKDTKVNAGVLTPVDVVHKAMQLPYYLATNEPEVLALDKYWANLKDYLSGATLNALAIVDVSGSMMGTPIEVAISLGLYCAERMSGPFANHFMTFSSNPELVEIRGVNLYQKIRNMETANWGGSTDLVKALSTIRDIAVENNLPQEQLPENLIIISDMEIDCAICGYNWGKNKYTTMDSVRRSFADAGYKCPKLIYWNVNARRNTILSDPDDRDITYVSGYSPVILEQILKGKTATDVMLDKLNSERYSFISC